MLSWSDLIFDCGQEQIDKFMYRLIMNSDPDDAMYAMMEFLSENYGGRYSFVYEYVDKDIYKKTYCTSTSESNMVQELPEIIDTSAVKCFWENIKEDEAIVIDNIENIRSDRLCIFEIFSVGDIEALILVPMYERYPRKGDMIGFIGATYSMKDELICAEKILRALGHIVPVLIEKRNLNRKLYYLSYHDHLTDVFNRHAYAEFKKSIGMYKSLGVIYCDISDLKHINDKEGYEKGDALIIFWSGKFKEIFEGSYKIFRIGGDEFFIMFMDCSKEEFDKQELSLRSAVADSDTHLAIGSAWTVAPDRDLRKLINTAENAMYMDKLNYYSFKEESGHEQVLRKNRNILECICKADSFSHFILNNYFNAATFFKSISLPNDYPYVGDMQSNLFYISDELRDLAGYESNIVPNLLEVWSEKISYPEDRRIYQKDIEDMLRDKRETHDLKYRIRDKQGEDVWIHCHGILKWNKDRSKPLFFAGKVSRQEQKFIIDPATNFPKEYAAIVKLESMKKTAQNVHIIGFTFNKFKDINDVYGRSATDLFLKELADTLNKEFQKYLDFFRLDGMQFVGIVNPNSNISVEDLIKKLRESITNMYYRQGILVNIPTSMGLISEAGERLSPAELLYNMASLLDEAKKTLERGYLLYSENYISKQRTKTGMVLALTSAVMNGFKGFRIVIQPIVDTKNLKIVAGETLLRWRFRGKDVSPAEIVPILEENSLIMNVGKWVFEEAVRECVKICEFLPKFRLSVNVSYFQILDTGFIIFMETILKKYGLDGKHMVVEITETHYDEAPAKVTSFIEECRKLGISVGIDDFGDGYSSLAFLLKHSARVVKLDKSLIREMLHSESNEVFISTVVHACHKLEKLVCAEGVETQKEKDAVISMGCDSIQGYYFHKPMELNKLHELIGGAK